VNSRRLLAAALTAFYALQATWTLYAGLDALLPVAEVAVQASADGCCASRCGCPDEVRARKACCCDPAAEAPVPSPGRFSAFEAARCLGVEAAMNQARTQPSMQAFPRLIQVPAVAVAAPLRIVFPVPPVEAVALDKVPLA
jgi:hypothetical protein